MRLKGLCTFLGHKTQCPQIYKLTHFKIMIVESFPENLTCWGNVVFEKWVKQCYENNFHLGDHDIVLTNFSKTTAPQQQIF